MNSETNQASTSKSTGKLRFILNENSKKEAASPPAKASQTKVRFVVPQTEKEIRRATKYIKKREFDIYINRLLKATRPEVSISRDAMDVLNTFCMDMLDRISKEASNLVKYNKTATLGIREIKSATNLVLPKDLADFAIIDANKALTIYKNSKRTAATANEDDGDGPECHCVC